MIQIRIIGIRKPGGAHNDHSAISHYQLIDNNGQVGIWDRMSAVNWILENPREHAAYIQDSRGDIAYCKVVKNYHGILFLETYVDNTFRDNLLSLPLI